MFYQLILNYKLLISYYLLLTNNYEESKVAYGGATFYCKMTS